MIKNSLRKFTRYPAVLALAVAVGVMSLVAQPVVAEQPSVNSSVKVDFDLNSVAPIVHTIQSIGGNPVVIPDIGIDFDGMTFLGWNTMANGRGQAYRPGDKVDASTILYAQWADGTHLDIPSERVEEDGSGSVPPSANGTTGSANNSGDTTGSAPGSPSAGVMKGISLQLTAPIGFIVAGVWASLAVLILTHREAMKLSANQRGGVVTKFRQSWTRLTTNRLYVGVLTASLLVTAGGIFWLCRDVTNAAVGVDNQGKPYNGYVTVADNTTWWYKAQKRTGESKRNGAWHYFDAKDNGYMVKDRDISFQAKEEYDSPRVETYRYNQDGKKVYGLSQKNGQQWHFDESTGVMTKGWYRDSKKLDYYYSTTDGHMLTGEHELHSTNEDDSPVYWYYFDTTTGVRYAGWKDFGNGRIVYHRGEDGAQMRGVAFSAPKYGDASQTGSYISGLDGGVLRDQWTTSSDGKTSYHTRADGTLYNFYEDGQGAGELETPKALAQLAVRVATAADNVDKPIKVNNAWVVVSDPRAQEYIRIRDHYTGRFDGDGTGNNTALASCTQAVGHIVRATVDPDFRMMGPNDARVYLESSPRWQYMGNINRGENMDSGKLQPGDVLADVNDIHTALYVGLDLARQGFPTTTGNTYQAHYATLLYPRLQQENSAAYTYKIFRYKGRSGGTVHPYTDVWKFLAGRGDWQRN